MKVSFAKSRGGWGIGGIAPLEGSKKSKYKNQ